MGIDRYEGFAERYDLFPDRSASKEAVEFFRRLFSQNSVHRVLDCACGTGRNLRLVHSLGCDVVGSDLSESMLEQAMRSLAEQRLRLTLHRLDYRELYKHFEEEFDAVLCLTTSIAEVPNDDEALQAFTSMRMVLRPNGILVLEQGTTDRQWRDKPRFILAADTQEVSRLFVIDYLGEHDARYNLVDIPHGNGGQDLKVWSTDLHILLRDDYQRLLEEAGFHEVEFYGSHMFDKYSTETSNRLIVIAHK